MIEWLRLGTFFASFYLLAFGRMGTWKSGFGYQQPGFQVPSKPTFSRMLNYSNRAATWNSLEWRMLLYFCTMEIHLGSQNWQDYISKRYVTYCNILYSSEICALISDWVRSGEHVGICTMPSTSNMVVQRSSIGIGSAKSEHYYILSINIALFWIIYSSHAWALNYPTFTTI